MIVEFCKPIECLSVSLHNVAKIDEVVQRNVYPIFYRQCLDGFLAALLVKRAIARYALIAGAMLELPYMHLSFDDVPSSVNLIMFAGSLACSTADRALFVARLCHL